MVSEMNESAVDPYEIALHKAMDDLTLIESEYRKALESAQLIDGRRRKLIETIRSLTELLNEDKKSYYLEKMLNVSVIRGIENRENGLIDDVIHIINREPEKEWSANDIKSKLKKKDEPLDQKALHNVLNYLYRKGDLRRVGRGLYRVVSSGVGVYCDDQNLELATGGGKEGTE